MNIFVGSLSFKTTEEELRKEFEAFGEVDTVKIILDQETRRSRGFAFVTMPDGEQATAAIAGINGKVLSGFTLKVNEARPREPRGGQPRERSGGYNSGDRGPGSGYGRPNSGYDGNRAGYDSNRGGYDSNRGGGYDSNRGGGYQGNRGGGFNSYRDGGGGHGNDASIYDTKDRGGGRKGRGGHGPGGSRPGGGRRSY